MNDDRLRAELARIGGALPDAADLPGAALAAGRRRVRRRGQAVRGVATVTAVTAAFAWYGAAGPGTTPASAQVACYPDRVLVAHRSVSLRRDGVHFDVTNATTGVVRLVAGDEAAIVPPGRTSVDVTLRPGAVSVTCDSGVPDAPAVSITVTDRHHLYVDDLLDCARPAVRAFRGTGQIVGGDPVALTAARVAGAVARDAVVEPAGYPAAAPRRLVRVRSGSYIVGLAVWHAMPERDTWTLDELRLCPAGRP